MFAGSLKATILAVKRGKNKKKKMNACLLFRSKERKEVEFYFQIFSVFQNVQSEPQLA